MVYKAGEGLRDTIANGSERAISWGSNNDIFAIFDLNIWPEILIAAAIKRPATRTAIGATQFDTNAITVADNRTVHAVALSPDVLRRYSTRQSAA